MSHELRVLANKGRSEIEIVMLADGMPLGAIKLTQEQAENHARAVIAAIEILQGKKKSSLLVSDDLPDAMRKPN